MSRVTLFDRFDSRKVRVFSGRELPKGFTFDHVLGRMWPAFQECAPYSQERVNNYPTHAGR